MSIPYISKKNHFHYFSLKSYVSLKIYHVYRYHRVDILHLEYTCLCRFLSVGNLFLYVLIHTHSYPVEVMAT